MVTDILAPDTETVVVPAALCADLAQRIRAIREAEAQVNAMLAGVCLTMGLDPALELVDVGDEALTFRRKEG